MSETPKDVPKSAGVGFTIVDIQKVKLPSVYIMLPPELINEVGGIVVAWGMFEQSFIDMLGAMIAENGSVYKAPWKFYSFDQRRLMFKAEAEKCFAQNPAILARLLEIMDYSQPLQIKRNTLVHGKLTLRVGGPEGPAIIAKGEHKKREVVETLTKDEINDLYYEIIHAAGLMAQFAMGGIIPFSPPLSSPDILRLRAVLSKSPTPPTKTSMISHPRQSSPP